MGFSQPSPLEFFIQPICWAPSLISVLRTMYGIDASSTRNRFEFIQLLHSRAAAVINNQIEMPSFTGSAQMWMTNLIFYHFVLSHWQIYMSETVPMAAAL